MVHNHIERLKSKISEMLVKSQASEARLIASEERLEQQQRIIDRNALLIQTLQTQATSNERFGDRNCTGGEISTERYLGKQFGVVTDCTG